MFLHKKKTNVTGTVRKNRKGMPKLTSKLEVGQTESEHTSTMLAIRWKDRRDVYMLTTQFENQMIAVIGKKDHHGNQVMKPLSVLKYNENMGAIDKTDMLLSSVECVRKTIKWYKKLFFHLIDLSLLNAYSSYKTVTGKHLSLASYQLQLIREILTKYSKKSASNKTGHPHSRDTVIPMRLSDRHFPTTVSPTSKKINPQRRCYVCQKLKNKRKDTTFMCKECDVGLCPVPCFEIYHTNNKV